MEARRLVGSARRLGDQISENMARGKVNAAKRELGERGSVWWNDGAPDLNRQMVDATPYASWFATLSKES
jgi:hypothetical protein